MSAAQNQHYVPKFILRQFLCNAEKEQVQVFDKHSDREFITSIDNIMAERRFHDFTFDDKLLSFETGFSQVESEMVKVYRKVVEDKRLHPQDEDEKTILSFLVALQFVRTRSHREQSVELDKALTSKVKSMGGRMEDVEGWTPPTEDRIKRDHFTGIRRSLPTLSMLIHQKDLVLCQSGVSRSFYLGDHPVSLYNEKTFGPYGNLGLGVMGIEIYMPLSPDLMLGAWCPSILKSIRDRQVEGKAQRRKDILAAAFQGRFPISGIKPALDLLAPLEAKIDDFIATVDEGRPILSDGDNMDFFNSLQAMFAYRFVISQSGDFDLARRHNLEFPKFRKGLRPTLG